MRPSLSHRQALGASLTLLGAHNVVQNTVLNERGYMTGNLFLSAVLVGLGRGAGLSREDLGLVRGDMAAGRRMIGWSATGAGLGVGLALLNPGRRRLLRDDRTRAQSTRDIVERTLVRFPWGTALFEEVAFRGVLPALLRPGRAAGQADLMAATAFGLWHIVPTIRALGGNPAGDQVSGPARFVVVVGGCLAAGLAGLGLSSMRNRTGSLLAPWAVHSLANVSMYLAGVLAHRIDGRP